MHKQLKLPVERGKEATLWPHVQSTRVKAREKEREREKVFTSRDTSVLEFLIYLLHYQRRLPSVITSVLLHPSRWLLCFYSCSSPTHSPNWSQHDLLECRSDEGLLLKKKNTPSGFPLLCTKGKTPYVIWFLPTSVASLLALLFLCPWAQLHCQAACVPNTPHRSLFCMS